MIGIICAVSSNGVFSESGKIPWYYPEDFKHFKKMTINSTVLMGRLTFDSMNGKPLPNRRNIIISKFAKLTSNMAHNPEIAPSVPEALKLCDPKQNIWFIGGARIYQEGMLYADEIHLTIVPDFCTGVQVVKFPWINPNLFHLASMSPLVATDGTETNLIHCVYKIK